MTARVSKSALFASLPPEWPGDLMPAIRQAVAVSGRKVVVLDDDPTGTQTVHDIPVWTEWSVESLRAELANDFPAFFILTNSRSLPAAEAGELNREIARNLADAAVSDRLVRAIRLPMKSAMNSGLGTQISKSAHSGAPHHAELELGALVHRKPPRHILRALGT